MSQNNSQTIGNLELRTDKNGNLRGDMKLYIPPFGPLSFSVSTPPAEETENMTQPPALWIWNGKQKYGALWKNVSAAGTEYLSGKFFCYGFTLNQAYIAAFEVDNRPGHYRVVLNLPND